jgi:dihydrofolate synthase/folylpolyglutamate synthase
MNYQETIQYLESLPSFGKEPGLKRIRALLEVLGHPEEGTRYIHITGTNGKGSVAAMMTSVLENAMLRIGRYTSPHLQEYTERIYANGHNISEDDFARLGTKIKEAASQIEKDGMESPTEFDALTAMAFCYFKEQKLDYAVMEVGMGGLYDSTNVITPVVSVITNVAMDHMKYLGNTLEEIAHQKAGIMKKGVPVVTSALHVGLKQLRQEAKEKGCPLYFYPRDFEIRSRRAWGTGQAVVIRRKILPQGSDDAVLYIPFVGAHQAVNGAVAAEALTLIMQKDHRINENDLREGLARTRWPGRFEINLIKGVQYVMDGAHNPAGAEALSEALKEAYPDKKRLIVFASLKDKDTQTIIQELVRKGDHVFLVEAPTPRTRTTDELADMIKEQRIQAEIKKESSVSQALEDACKEATPDDIVLVCGSLYILGDAENWIYDKAAKEAEKAD